MLALCRMLFRVAFVVGVPATASAGLMTLDGTEKTFWNDHAIVIARVQRARFTEKTRALTVRILAVAATDRLVKTKLTFREPNSSSDSLAAFNPKRSEVYILCLCFVDGAWQLETAGFSFFPPGLSPPRIEGLADPRLQQVLDRIGPARAEARRKAAQPDD